MEINARTRLCVLLGNPVEHSVSPQIHNSAFRTLGLNYVYLAFSVLDLEGAVRGIRAFGIRGASITIPYKEKIIPYLDQLDELAEKIGAVNTVVNEQGKLLGYNTDGEAVYQALKDYGINLEASRVIILGAGGACRSIAFTLASKSPKSRLLIFNRTFSRAKALAEEIKEKTRAEIQALAWEEEPLKKELSRAQLLINATSVGMYPEIEQSPIPAQWLHSRLWVFDIVYNPLETQLLKQAKKIGAKTIAGLEMLVRQAGEQFRLWTGKAPPLEVMFSAGKQALAGV